MAFLASWTRCFCTRGYANNFVFLRELYSGNKQRLASGMKSLCLTQQQIHFSTASQFASKYLCKLPKSSAPLIEMFVDADRISIEAIQQVVEEVSRCGSITRKVVFAEPARIENKRWSTFLKSNNFVFSAVARNAHGSEDPNDVALTEEVRKVLSSNETRCIALVVLDKDFIPLVEEIVARGVQCIVCLPRHNPGLHRRFDDAGANTFILRNEEYASFLPKMFGVLHGDGSGSMSKRSCAYVQESEDDNDNMRMHVEKLCALHYRCDHNDPVLPSVAKFWFENKLGDLVVYPLIFANRSLAKLFTEKPNAIWKPGRQDLAFVFPMTNITRSQKIIADYGNPQCAQRALGGGPFMLRKSSTLAEEILTNMGYLGTYKNHCLDEAIDTFWQGTMNQRAIRKAGMSIERTDKTKEKLDKLVQVCLSSKFVGTLQIPPRDQTVREFLVARGLLRSAGVSNDVVYEAMLRYTKKSGLHPLKSYHGLVSQCLDSFSGRMHDPMRRNPTRKR